MKDKLHPITCKCGKYHSKKNQGKYCSRCKTSVTFKSLHNKGDVDAIRRKHSKD